MRHGRLSKRCLTGSLLLAASTTWAQPMHCSSLAGWTASPDTQAIFALSRAERSQALQNRAAYVRRLMSPQRSLALCRAAQSSDPAPLHQAIRAIQTDVWPPGERTVDKTLLQTMSMGEVLYFTQCTPDRDPLKMHLTHHLNPLPPGDAYDPALILRLIQDLGPLINEPLGDTPSPLERARFLTDHALRDDRAALIREAFEREAAYWEDATECFDN